MWSIKSLLIVKGTGMIGGWEADRTGHLNFSIATTPQRSCFKVDAVGTRIQLLPCKQGEPLSLTSMTNSHSLYLPYFSFKNGVQKYVILSYPSAKIMFYWRLVDDSVSNDIYYFCPKLYIYTHKCFLLKEEAKVRSWGETQEIYKIILYHNPGLSNFWAGRYHTLCRAYQPPPRACATTPCRAGAGTGSWRREQEPEEPDHSSSRSNAGSGARVGSCRPLARLPVGQSFCDLWENIGLQVQKYNCFSVRQSVIVIVLKFAVYDLWREVISKGRCSKIFLMNRWTLYIIAVNYFNLE